MPADKLRINLEFSEFEDGFKKDEEIIIQRQMSKQLPIGGAGNIEQVATAVTQASTAVVASTMVL